MIIVELPAKMACSEKDCAASLPARLALLATGGFGFQPADADAAKDWQVVVPPNGVFTCFCPAHKKETQRIHTQVGPAGKRLYVRE